ncbi:MAG: glutathione S-transferase family protein [Pseudomonadota bacterium]
MQRLLFGESFSPWSKKARWAMEQCGVTYTYREYTPTLSEPGLRWRMRQWAGAVSVPVLFAGDQTLRGSWDISRFANESAGDERLGSFDAISPWNELSEHALAEGRTRVVRSVLSNPAALSESLPAFVPSALRAPLRFVARDAASRLDRKYAHLVKPGSLRNALLQTREGLAKAGGDFLAGRFSYADITMAAVLEVVKPIAITDPPLGPAVQTCWIDAQLADEFGDLIEWRDRLAAGVDTSYSQFQ